MKLKPITVIRSIGIFAMLVSPMTGFLSLIAGIGIIFRKNWARLMGIYVFIIWFFISFILFLADIFIPNPTGSKLLVFTSVLGFLFGFCAWLLARKEIVGEFKNKKVTI